MIETVRTYIEKHKLLIPDEPVLVGLSGGADSVALLSVLCKLGYTCIAAHCNFHLRGDESQRDETFCKELALHFQIPFHKADFETSKYAKEKHISIEMAARELRYEWFEKLRQEVDAQAIAVAHHQDDNVETLLMNLCRGTGIRGLAGIRPKNNFVVRPLLSITRNDILHWLDMHNLSHVTDSTNLSDIYTRNFIRHKVVPLLEEVNPSVSNNISRTANLLSGVESLYLYAIEEIHKKVFVKDDYISITALMAYPAPEVVLYEILKPYGFNRFVVADVFSVLNKESGKSFYSSTHHLVKDRQYLQLTPIEADIQQRYVLSPDETIFDGAIKLSFQKREIAPDFSVEKNKNIAFLDYDKLTFPLVLRTWEKGDRFVPFGMKGQKKISDYFSDNKYSLIDKKKAWLLCSGDDIIWIVGDRVDDRFCIKKDTKRAFIIYFL